MPSKIAEVLRSFSSDEKRNIAWYSAGIITYKFGIEFFNGSISTLAADRFKASNAFTKLGAAQGINLAAQCVGAILIAPLIKRWPTRTVLSAAIIGFALITTILLIVDAATGGKMKGPGDTKPNYGDWNPNAIFVIWTLSGIFFGMVELIRRVIPADVVGCNVSKLRRMDATVHIFNELAGTAGAFASSSAISRFGNNYSFFLTPIFFVASAFLWTRIGVLSFRAPGDAVEGEDAEQAAARQSRSKNYFAQIGHGALLFVKSIYTGAAVVMSHRKFIWLFSGYSIALYLHRFVESAVVGAYAKRVLGVSAWSQLINGGSNFGEMLGAVAVLILSDHVQTPLPWLRLDAIMLNLVWVIPAFARMAVAGDVSWAWRLAGCMIPISFGWSAGDVSLAAYIQSSFSSTELASTHKDISLLGAVFAFLLSSTIVINAVLSSVLGKVIDRDFVRNGNIFAALSQVGGIQFSVGFVIVFASTFIPRGAFAWNPKVLPGMYVDEDTSDDGSEGSESGDDKIKGESEMPRV